MPGQPPPVALATPPSDGTQCYDNARVPFYQTGNTALLVDEQQARTRQTGQIMAGVGTGVAIAGLFVGGTAGKVMLGVGALTALAGALTSNVQTDQRIIADVSYSFNGLVRCRQDEARQIRLDVRARRLKYAEGRERLRALHDLMLTDVDVALRVNAALARRNQTYGVAAAEVDTELAKNPTSSDSQKRVQDVNQAKQTIQSNQRALTDQASAMNKAAQTITVSSIEPDRAPV